MTTTTTTILISIAAVVVAAGLIGLAIFGLVKFVKWIKPKMVAKKAAAAKAKAEAKAKAAAQAEAEAEAAAQAEAEAAAEAAAQAEAEAKAEAEAAAARQAEIDAAVAAALKKEAEKAAAAKAQAEAEAEAARQAEAAAQAEAEARQAEIDAAAEAKAEAQAEAEAKAEAEAYEKLTDAQKLEVRELKEKLATAERRLEAATIELKNANGVAGDAAAKKETAETAMKLAKTNYDTQAGSAGTLYQELEVLNLDPSATEEDKKAKNESYEKAVKLREKFSEVWQTAVTAYAQAAQTNSKSVAAVGEKEKEIEGIKSEISSLNGEIAKIRSSK